MQGMGGGGGWEGRVGVGWACSECLQAIMHQVSSQAKYQQQGQGGVQYTPAEEYYYTVYTPVEGQYYTVYTPVEGEYYTVYTPVEG